MRNRKEQKKLF